MRTNISDGEILEYIGSFKNIFGYSPSFRDICKHFGKSSTNWAKYRLEILRKSGSISYQPTLSRSIVLAQEGK